MQSRSVAMPTDLKFRNRKNILDVFRSKEELCVNEVAACTGISRQTVVKSVNFFLEKGLIVSLGKGSSTQIGGKRPELYSFNKKYRYMFFAVISDKNVVVGIANLKREIIATSEFDIRKSETLKDIAAKIADVCFETAKKNKIKDSLIENAGICTSGIYDRKTGIMKYNSIFPEWGYDLEIRNIFNNVFKNKRIIIDNEARMSGIAEIAKNTELKDKRVLCIYTSKGIAAALIEKGAILYGKNSLIGEIGHLSLNCDCTDKCSCGSSGCFENILSEDKLLNMYNESSENKVKTMEEIFARSQNESDFAARKVILYCADYFSAALKNMILLTDPDKIIIQGKFTKAGNDFIHIVKDKLSEFKYFANTDFDIVFDFDDLKMLRINGTCEMLIKDMFGDEKIYV